MKASSLIWDTVAGIETPASDVQPEKALEYMPVRLSGKVTSRRDVALANTSVPIDLTEEGRFIETSEVQPRNMLELFRLTLSDNSTDWRELQY